MRLSMHIKPKKVTGLNKSDIMNKINGFHSYTVTSHGNFLSSFRDKNMVRVYNIEKRRKKVELRTKNGKMYHQIVSHNHWVGFTYDIPFEIIKTMNIKIVQYSRHFRVYSK